MYSTACPSCGAPVSFKSAASVMAVCEYCRATLVREADAVRDIGKMSAVLEDSSPIRITTQGVFEGRSFAVVGRIQLRYDAGYWNEWYVLFDDGQGGWLADASGQYTLTVDIGPAADAPLFEALTPGQPYLHDGEVFTAADIRSARCTGGEGELPFRVGEGWEARVADFRQRRRFLTLDYSDGLTPQRYLGKAVDLDTLKCQLLRTDEEIVHRAGRLRGKITGLECPGCGGPLAYPAAVATQLVCPSCGTRSDLTGDQAVVLGKQAELKTHAVSLELGAKARIGGQSYTLIGMMRCQEEGETGFWTEYLLYSPRKGFLWLVESEDGWERVQVLDDWPVPAPTSNSAVRLGEQNFQRKVAYRAVVRYAAGAFNWQVKAGDSVAITDWQSGRDKLTQERSDAELVWSRAAPVTQGEIDSWFGRTSKSAASAVAAQGKAKGDSAGGLGGMAKYFTYPYLLFNVPISLFADGSWILTLIGLGLLWWPVISNAGETE